MLSRGQTFANLRVLRPFSHELMHMRPDPMLQRENRRLIERATLRAFLETHDVEPGDEEELDEELPPTCRRACPRAEASSLHCQPVWSRYSSQQQTISRQAQTAAQTPPRLGNQNA